MNAKKNLIDYVMETPENSNRQVLEGLVQSIEDESNVQPDWEQNDETAKDFIKNRPVIGSGSPEVEIFSGRVGTSFSQSITLSAPLEYGKTYLLYSNYTYDKLDGAKRIAEIYEDGTRISIELESGAGSISAVLGSTDALYNGPESTRNIKIVKPADPLKIDPSKIPDMYYTEEVERRNFGYNAAAWAACVKAHEGSLDSFEEGQTGWPITFSYDNKTYSKEGTYNVIESVPTITYALTSETDLEKDHLYSIVITYPTKQSDATVKIGTPSGYKENIYFLFIALEEEKVHKIPEKYLPNTDNSPLIVTITGTTTDGNTTYSADHTFEEIKAAVEAGQNVFVMYSGQKCQLKWFAGNEVAFGYTEKLFNAVSRDIYIPSSNIVEVTETTINELPEPTEENAGQVAMVNGLGTGWKIAEVPISTYKLVYTDDTNKAGATLYKIIDNRVSTTPMASFAEDTLSFGRENLLLYNNEYYHQSDFLMESSGFWIDYIHVTTEEDKITKKKIRFEQGRSPSMTYSEEIIYNKPVIDTTLSSTSKNAVQNKVVKEAIDNLQTNFILSSSTSGSTKKFKITVDDSGTLTAAEVTS